MPLLTTSLLLRLACTRHHLRRQLAGAVVVVLSAFGACSREPVAPSSTVLRADRQAPRAVAAPPVAVGALLDSFSIAGVYTVLPRGGYAGGMSYARSPEKEVYAGRINNHPTGLVFPVGLPIRVLAEGRLTSQSTPAFQAEYCWRHGAWDPICSVSAFEYTVHGSAPWYEGGTGLSLTWWRSASYYDRFYGLYSNAEFFRWRVPSADTLSRRELHFNRMGCCYYIPWGTTAAWETYEGVWRFGAVPDDGGQAELGVPPLLRLRGPRTDGPQATPANFTVEASPSESIVTTRWWYIRAANNVFDGERLDSVATGTPYPPYVPRYPNAQRSSFEELFACEGRTTCTYQPVAAGAVVVQAILRSGLVLAARNTGASGAHVKITVDSTTLTYGDTTVFRVTAPGASQWSVTGYSFVPLASAPLSALRAVRGNVDLNATEEASISRHGVPEGQSTAARAPSGRIPEAALPVRPRRSAQFLDAEFACDDATTVICFDDPQHTGYEIVTAVVDGESQRDSVLVTVAPGLLVSCTPSSPVRRTDVHCVASMSDSSDFVVTRLRSTMSGTTIVDTSITATSTHTSFDWSGPAIAATTVEIFGASQVGSVRGHASFLVVKDTARFHDAAQPDAPEPRRASGRPILSAPYPGMIRTDHGWMIQSGGLGHTWHLWPDYTLSIVRTGPNLGLVHADSFAWFDPRPGGAQATPVSAGTYLSVALFPEDFFYRLQRGGGDHCTAGDLETLRREIYAHEAIHYRKVIALRLQLELHSTYESAAILSRDSSISPAIELAFNRPTATYFRSMKAIDSLIDLHERATTSITCDMRFP